MTDMNETQWWKKYASEFNPKSVLISRLDGELTKEECEKAQKLSDIWQDYEIYTIENRTFSSLEEITQYNLSAPVLEDILKFTNNTKNKYGNDDEKFFRNYMLRNINYNSNILDCHFSILKETQLNFGGLESVILAHKDCTEKDLIEIAKTSAQLGVKQKYDEEKDEFITTEELTT